MKHLVKFCVLIVLFAFISCDPSFRAVLVNKTRANACLIIRYDKIRLEESYRGNQYVSYLKCQTNNTGTLLSIDTNDLSTSWQLKPDEEFVVEGELGTEPEFYLIKEIVVVTKDTLRLSDKQSMVRAFKEKSKRNFVFEVN